MSRSDSEIRAEVKRLEDGVAFAENAAKEFEDDPGMHHTFIVLRAKYNLKIKTLKWVLNEDS